MSENQDSNDAAKFPWLPVVRFHLDIVKRAEDSFFSFPPVNTGTERSTCLADFEPESFAGPWDIDIAQVASAPFLQASLGNRHESAFLGGPGFMGRVRDDKNQWIDVLQPLLYREVSLHEFENSILIKPDSGRWDLNPLVLKNLSEKETAADELADMVGEMIEAAERRLADSTSDNHTLASWIWDFLHQNKVPVDLIRGQKKLPENVSDWMLFAPSTNVSSMHRTLHREYSRLEKYIRDNPDHSGGLALIEPENRKNSPVSSAQNSLSVNGLVPLNAAQRASVERIMQGEGVTVISGPPGTGKSQVIVSALLNAWALGKSVLFASQNNKAVDVVVDRLKEFEDHFPILVRAGAKKHQNILTVIQDVLGYAGTSATALDDSRDPEHLQRQIDDLSDRINTGIPQRITEMRTAAFDDLARYEAARAEIQQVQQQLHEELSTHQVAHFTFDEFTTALTSNRAWMAQLGDARNIIQDELHVSAQIKQQIAEGNTRRRASLAAIGVVTDFADWSWAATDNDLNAVSAWSKLFAGYTVSDIARQLTPADWIVDYEQWRSVENADAWANSARSTTEIIRACVDESAEKITAFERLKADLAPLIGELKRAGVPPDTSVSRQTIDRWRELYALVVTSPPSVRKPLSRGARYERQLRRMERSLSVELPQAVAAIGVLDANGRRQLSRVADVVIRWLSGPHEQYREMTKIEHSLTEAFDALRAPVEKLGRTPPELNFASVSTWRTTSTELEQAADLADAAAEAMRQNAQRKALRGQLSATAQQLIEVTGNLILVYEWSTGVGKPFMSALRNLAADPTVIAFEETWKAHARGDLSDLFRAWNQTHVETRQIQKLEEQLKAIPSSTQRLTEWRLKRPQTVILDKPDDADFESLAEQLRTFDSLTETWEFTEKQQLPELEARCLAIRDDALRQLKRAADTVREADATLDLGVIDEVLQQPDNPWPQDAIAALFDPYQIDVLEGRKLGLQRQLQQVKFQVAKIAWLARLRTDSEALDALALLKKQYTHSLNLHDQYGDTFRKALRLLPVWSTTALSAQSLPLEPDLFDIVIIDEASQCTLTNVLPLLFRAKNLVVIGDQNQLPPIPFIAETEEQALATKHRVEDVHHAVGHAGNDIFDTAIQALPTRHRGVISLVEHFRSHPQIIAFANKAIYQQRLELKKKPAQTHLPIASGVHVQNVRGLAERADSRGSWINRQEAEQVRDTVNQLLASGGKYLSIGVVTPFRGQKELIRSLLDNPPGVLIDTAHAFQGDERDIIVFSPVVANGMPDSSAKWASQPPNLINVSLTRAREALVVIGDIDFCATQPGILSELAKYCRDIQLLQETSPAELELFSWMALRGFDPYIHQQIGDIEVDFVLENPNTGLRVAVEVDGREFHANHEAEDRARDAFLRGKGYRVLRLPASDVFRTPADVIHRIEKALNDSM